MTELNPVIQLNLPVVGLTYRDDEEDLTVTVTQVFTNRVFYTGDADGDASVNEFNNRYKLVSDSSDDSLTDAQVDAGFAEFEKRGFQTTKSDISIADLKAVYFAMRQAELVDAITQGEPSPHYAATVTAYQIGMAGNRLGHIRVEIAQQMDGRRLWAVRNGLNVLGADGLWVYEPMPSNRDEQFFQNYRFPTAHAAISAAQSSIRKTFSTQAK